MNYKIITNPLGRSDGLTKNILVKNVEKIEFLREHWIFMDERDSVIEILPSHLVVRIKRVG